MWYLWVLVGFVVGYIVKDIMPADVQYKGKIKQKGEVNKVLFGNKDKPEKRRLFKRKK